jgi:hypothetical protein
MLLRVSGAMTGAAVDLGVVNDPAEMDGGVMHGARLLAFTDAVMRGDAPALERERRLVRALLGPEAFVDLAAVIASFNVVDRIADATGIPLDDALGAASADVRRELGLGRFVSAANTPGAGIE